MENKEINSLAVKSAFWMLICTFLTSALSFITTPIFTRLMPPESYGIVSTYVAWQDIIGIVLSLSLGTSINRAYFDFKEDIKGYIASTIVLLGITVAFGSMAVHFVFEAVGISYPVGIELLLYARTFLNLIMTYYFTHQRLAFRYKASVLFTFIYIALNIFCALVGVALFREQAAYAKIVGNNIGTMAVGLGVLIYYMSKRKWSTLVRPDYWKYALALGLPIMVQLIGFKILTQSDKLMIERMCGDYDAGLYSVPYSIGSILQIFWNCLAQGVYPWMYRRLEVKAYSEVKRVMGLMFKVMALATITLSCMAPLIMRIMAPPEYQSGVYVLMPIVMGLYFSFLNLLLITYATYYKQVKLVPVTTIIGTVLNLVLNYFGILWFGYIAAAYVTILCNVVLTGLNYALIYRKIGNDAFPVRVIALDGILVFLISVFMVYQYPNVLLRYSIFAVILSVAGIYFWKNMNVMKKIYKEDR